MGRRPIAISDENREVPLQEHRVMLIVRCLTPTFSYILKKAAHFKSRTPTRRRGGDAAEAELRRRSGGVAVARPGGRGPGRLRGGGSAPF